MDMDFAVVLMMVWGREISIDGFLNGMWEVLSIDFDIGQKYLCTIIFFLYWRWKLKSHFAPHVSIESSSPSECFFSVLDVGMNWFRQMFESIEAFFILKAECIVKQINESFAMHRFMLYIEQD